MILQLNSRISKKELNTLLDWSDKLKYVMNVITVLELNKLEGGRLPKNIKNNLEGNLDFVTFNVENLNNLSKSDMVDEILDLSELGVEVNLLGKCSEDLINMVAEFELKTVRLSKEYNKHTLDNRRLDTEDLAIIHEIFQTPINVKQVSARDLTLRLIIDSLDDFRLITYDKREIRLPHKELFSMENIKFIMEIEKEQQFNLIKFMDSPLSLKVSQPIELSDHVIENILEYKWGIFELIKTWKPENMEYLPHEVISLCNSNQFVPFDDIKSILNSTYPLLKYYGGE